MEACDKAEPRPAMTRAYDESQTTTHSEMGAKAGWYWHSDENTC